MSPIQKSFVTPNGQVGNFWIVDGVYMAADMGAARAFVHLYTTQNDYLTGAQPIFKGEVVLTNEENPVTMHQLVNLVENKLVTLPGNFLSGTVI